MAGPLAGPAVVNCNLNCWDYEILHSHRRDPFGGPPVVIYMINFFFPFFLFFFILLSFPCFFFFFFLFFFFFFFFFLICYLCTLPFSNLKLLFISLEGSLSRDLFFCHVYVYLKISFFFHAYLLNRNLTRNLPLRPFSGMIF